MKRFVLSALTIVLVAGAVTPVSAAVPRQTHLGDPVADLNGDGTVSLTELKNYNRDARQKN
ncbi:MAG: EF-hand domain-containing protein [Cyanobacteria bacterium J06636_16]